MSDQLRRGFPVDEFESRHNRASKYMYEAGLDGLLVTSEQHFRYFSGFDSQFWASPTRPWFLVIPRDKPIVAVIPEIGKIGMEKTWIKDIRTWPAPVPEDDGITLLSDTIKELGSPNLSIGTELGHEMVLRMPILDFEKLSKLLLPIKIGDATTVLKKLRAIKSEREIQKISHICSLVSDAFEVLPEKVKKGLTEREICKIFCSEMLFRGADSAPYVLGVSGPGGYDNIIMGPSDRRPQKGDILIIDTGATFDGYFCDFDRNFSFGPPSNKIMQAYRLVYEATEEGIRAARPGNKASDLWRAMAAVLEAGGANVDPLGRMGHGLGMQLTEWPSNKIDDDTILAPGMVMTIEPGIEFEPNRLMVHEENLLITADGYQMLSRRALPEITVIE